MVHLTILDITTLTLNIVFSTFLGRIRTPLYHPVLISYIRMFMAMLINCIVWFLSARSQLDGAIAMG